MQLMRYKETLAVLLNTNQVLLWNINNGKLENEAKPIKIPTTE